MSNKKAILVAIGGLFCMTILAAMLINHAYPLWTGKEIYLKVRPIDPRDTFRGDYVILSYDIQRVRLGTTPQPTERKAKRSFDWWRQPYDIEPIGDWTKKLHDNNTNWRQRNRIRDTVLYVQLKPVASDVPGVPKVHRPVSICDQPQPDAINLRGRIRDFGNESYYSNDKRIILTMDYGIDAFFVQEGTGRPIENAMARGSNKKVHAVVAVTDSGVARLKDLVVGGERLAER